MELASLKASPDDVPIITNELLILVPDSVRMSQDSLTHSQRLLNSQTSCAAVWALAVFGRLDLAFLQFVIAQLKPTDQLQVSSYNFSHLAPT